MLNKIATFIISSALSVAAWGLTWEAIVFTPVLYFLLQAMFHPYQYCSSRRRKGFLFKFFCYEGRLPMKAAIINSVVVVAPISALLAAGSTLWAVCFALALVGIIHNQVW